MLKKMLTYNIISLKKMPTYNIISLSILLIIWLLLFGNFAYNEIFLRINNGTFYTLYILETPFIYVFLLYLINSVSLVVHLFFVVRHTSEYTSLQRTSTDINIFLTI